MILKRKFKLINNAVFEENMKYVRKYNYIKLVITERRKIYLVSERNNYTTKLFREHLLPMETKKTEILMNTQAHLGF